MNAKLCPVFSERCQQTIVYFCTALRCPVNVLKAMAFASLPTLGLEKPEDHAKWIDELEKQASKKGTFLGSTTSYKRIMCDVLGHGRYFNVSMQHGKQELCIVSDKGINRIYVDIYTDGVVENLPNRSSWGHYVGLLEELIK